MWASQSFPTGSTPEGYQGDELTSKGTQGWSAQDLHHHDQPGIPRKSRQFKLEEPYLHNLLLALSCHWAKKVRFPRLVCPLRIQQLRSVGLFDLRLEISEQLGGGDPSADPNPTNKHNRLKVHDLRGVVWWSYHRRSWQITLQHIWWRIH